MYSSLRTKQIVLTVLILLAVKHATILSSSEAVQAINTSADLIEACFNTSIFEPFPGTNPTSSLLNASTLLCSSSITVMSFSVYNSEAIIELSSFAPKIIIFIGDI